LATGDLGHLWKDGGPTAEAVALLKGGHDLHQGQRALLLAAWAFWSGEPVPLRFHQLIGLGEAEPICKLMIATFYGPRAVDVWLTRSDEYEGFVATRADVHGACARLLDGARATFAENSEEAINFTSAPDACALGALKVAEYVLMDGVAPVRRERSRRRKAVELTVEVLGLYAAVAHEAEQRERLSEDEIDEEDESPPEAKASPC
jgi:hypothetical protein